MTTAFRSRAGLLFFGDLLCFTLALWGALFLRAFEPPAQALFVQHLVPFTLLFVVWIGVFVIAGLYENRFIILARREIGATLLVAQSINVAIAALFFFLVPGFGIAPKTVLAIYLVVSFLLILLWRVALFPTFFQKPENALLVGQGAEIDALAGALEGAPHAPARIAKHIRPDSAVGEEIARAIAELQPRFVIADFNDPDVARALPAFINYLAQGVRFIDALSLYEEVLGRVAIEKVDDAWLARNVSRYAHSLYDPVKRLMDIAVALPAALLSLLLYPFIAVAIYLEDGGAPMIVLPRVGQDGKVVPMHKFRSMSGNDRGAWGGGASQLTVTRVGRFLRATRLDELPQLWDVLLGNLSLIGPRPEFPATVVHYEREIPYYGVRHLVRPGLSGWAQLYHDNHPHHGADVAATREKLSYDLYYLKHRSLALDAVIALKTIKKLLTRSGV